VSIPPGKKEERDEGSEFADYMADISQEISQRVGSLDAALPAAAPPPPRRIPTPAQVSEAGMILEWDNIADRMLEEML
jgi:hypothetical protein